MKSKKYVSRVIVLITVLVMCYLIPAEASNYTDTVFDFYFKSATGLCDTELREKQDDTSVYMKCNSTTYPYTAFAVGAYSVGTTRYDLSGGHNYTFYSGTVYKMINYVYENNVPYAAIRAERSYATSYYATGLWSPDSI